MYVPDSDLIQLMMSLMIVGGILLLTIPSHRVVWGGIGGIGSGSLFWCLQVWSTPALSFLFGALLIMIMGQAIRLIASTPIITQ